MKLLDKYLLKLLINTFTTVFVILFFIFILQTVWLFISELAGKDLDFVSVIKFLLFASPRVVPLVLPLSVLLASIMTFGSLAENYEFAAMKSSGISLQRAMKSLTVFILLLSIVAFIFANNVIPYAEYKFINFRRNIAQVKPAMAIAEGQFSEIGNFTIKVEKKYGPQGKYLDGVTIHKRSLNGVGGNTIIKAKKGELESSESSNVLKLILRDGNYYEDIIPKKFEERNKIPFAKSYFKRYVINIDLSKLNQNQDLNNQVSNTNTMQTIGELNYTLDSLSTNFKKDMTSYVDNVTNRSIFFQKDYTNNATPLTLNDNSVLSNFDDNQKQQILRIATSNMESTVFSIENSKFEFESKQKNINEHWIALYDKFVIAFACLLMFFIGAPLGAIIRKGGLGMPIVFSVMIFIIFHFINTFGKKVAQEDGITPFLGCWMSTIVLAPLAVVLTYRATNDIGIISFDGIALFFQNLFSKEKRSTIPLKEIIEKKEETVVLTSNQEKEVTALFVHYKKQNGIACGLNLALILSVLFFGFETLYTKIIILTLGLIFYFVLLKATLTLKKITQITKTKKTIGLLSTLLIAFPFYCMVATYNFFTLKK